MPDYRGGDAARRDTGGVYSDVEACTTHSLGQERGFAGKSLSFCKKIVMSLLFLWFIIKKCDIVM